MKETSSSSNMGPLSGFVASHGIPSHTAARATAKKGFFKEGSSTGQIELTGQSKVESAHGSQARLNTENKVDDFDILDVAMKDSIIRNTSKSKKKTNLK